MARRLPATIRRSVQRQATRLLETGQRFKRFDQIRQRHFWSSYFFQPDVNGYVPSNTYKLFITPPGQMGQGFPVSLTDRETNWKSANRIPDNQNLEVLELGVSVQPTPDFEDIVDGFLPPNRQPTGRQVNDFMGNTIVAIQYLTNEVSLGFCNDFAQASGPQMGMYQPIMAGFAVIPPDPPGAPPPPAGSQRYVTNGFCAPGLRRRLRIPILLQHGETFSFNFIIPRSFFLYASQPAEQGETTGLYVRLDFWATESFVEKS